MEPKAQAAERLLRGLGVAVKTFALYPLPHPVTVRAVDNLMTLLRRYTDAHGPFAVRVSKHALAVDGITFRTGTHASLAIYLFTRKIAHFRILPAVSEQALSSFIAALGTDRASLEAVGGVRHLLREGGIGNIQITEMVLEQEAEEPEPLDLSGILEMLGRGRASPQERDHIVEILHGGPAQAGMLLGNIVALAGGAVEGSFTEETIEQAYEAVQSLDRLIIDEPFEDQPRLYSSLAAATIAMGEPLRSALVQTLLRRGAGRGTLRMLGRQLPAEELATIIGGTLTTEEDIAGQVAGFLRALCQDRQKARAVLAILDTRLQSSNRPAAWLTDAVWPRIEAPARGAPRVPSEFVLEGGAPSPPTSDLDNRARETRSVDELSVVREVALTLVDILRQEPAGEDHRETTDLTDALAGYLGWLAGQQEYALLAAVLAKIHDVASREGGRRRTIAAGVLKHTAESPVVDGMLAVLWDARGTATERQIRACLDAMADHLVRPLVQALGSEQRAGARAQLCDLIIHLYHDRVADLASFITDQRWYLVRNIADILGRMRSPQAVSHLSRLVTHPDYRVRRETLNALSSIGTGDAQSILMDFIDDPDERLRLRAIQSLDSLEAWRAMPKLLLILEQRDFFNRQFELKQASLEALARLGARQSLPTVRRMAGARWVWGARGRELRRAAALAAAIIEGQVPLPRRGRPARSDNGDADL